MYHFDLRIQPKSNVKASVNELQAKLEELHDVLLELTRSARGGSGGATQTDGGSEDFSSPKIFVIEHRTACFGCWVTSNTSPPDL